MFIFHNSDSDYIVAWFIYLLFFRSHLANEFIDFCCPLYNVIEIEAHIITFFLFSVHHHQKIIFSIPTENLVRFIAYSLQHLYMYVGIVGLTRVTFNRIFIHLQFYDLFMSYARATLIFHFHCVFGTNEKQWTKLKG